MVNILSKSMIYKRSGLSSVMPLLTASNFLSTLITVANSLDPSANNNKKTCKITRQIAES